MPPQMPARILDLTDLLRLSGRRERERHQNCRNHYQDGLMTSYVPSKSMPIESRDDDSGSRPKRRPARSGRLAKRDQAE